MTQPAATRLTRQYNVFISYARADGRDLANRLYMALQDNGLRPWRDERNLNLGRDYTIEIERAIRAADYVVVLLTSDVAVRKEDSFVNCEILEAQARGKPIIPLITRGFDPVDVPLQIKHLTWMPFADFDTDLPRLLERFSEAPGYFAEPPPSDDPFHPYVERMRDFVNSYTYIALALTQLEDPRAVEELIAALADSDRFVRLNAADALGNIGNVRGVEALIAALRDPDGSVRSNAANALRRIGDARAVEPLLAALSDPDSFVRWSVADTLGQLGDIRAVKPLIAALGDPDSFVRRSAADALGQLGDHHAVEPLITALLGTDSFVRASAARALGQIGNACAVEPLKKLLSDDALGTRLKSRTGIKRVYDYAVEALERIGTPEALAVLKQWRRG